MLSSGSQLQTAEAQSTPTAAVSAAPASHWKSTFAFITDQLLQFWPPYRTEIHDDGAELSGDPSPGKSERPTRRLP
jgi:hypothetical protein